LDRASGVLEVVARGDLARGLVDRVANLLHVELGHDVERGHGFVSGVVVAWERGMGGLILYAAPGRYPSGQRGQAVNLLRKLRWFESNPAHSARAASASRPRRATG